MPYSGCICFDGAVLRFPGLRRDGLDEELEVERARVAGGLERVCIFSVAVGILIPV